MAETNRVWSTIAYEAITVTTAAIGFTATTYTKKVKRAICVVEATAGKGIRYRTDGTNPDATTGTLVNPGVGTYGTNAEFRIEGYRDIARFKAYRSSDADATLHVHYLGDD